MYNPKIYIRDYGSPTRRLLAISGQYEIDWFDVGLRRDLILHAENPATGEEYLLLDGDMQSGADLIDLSGAGNDLLVLTNNSLMRFFGSDVALQYSNISGFPSWSYELTFNDADLRRSLVMHAEGVSFVYSAGDAGLLRSLLMSADAGVLTITGVAAGFTTGKILTADPAAYSVTGNDVSLLRQLPMTASGASFAWSASDASLTRSLFMTGEAASFALTFRDAVVSTDNIEALSGDMQSGGDLTLLSGDAQTGEDFLLISQ